MCLQWVKPEQGFWPFDSELRQRIIDIDLELTCVNYSVSSLVSMICTELTSALGENWASSSPSCTSHLFHIPVSHVIGTSYQATTISTSISFLQPRLSSLQPMRRIHTMLYCWYQLATSLGQCHCQCPAHLLPPGLFTKSVWRLSSMELILEFVLRFGCLVGGPFCTCVSDLKACLVDLRWLSTATRISHSFRSRSPPLWTHPYNDFN